MQTPAESDAAVSGRSVKSKYIGKKISQQFQYFDGYNKRRL
jgi:hypothetical protein